MATYGGYMQFKKMLFVIAILFGEFPQQQQKHVGCIEIDCNPKSVVQDAYENARWLCDQYYLGAPEIEITEYNGKLF
jgi:pyruvate dehydrogenase kinase 2/3/4